MEDKAMTKDECRAYHKEKLKSMGFRSKNSFFYKFLDDNYAVGFYMNHSSYGREYTCEIGGQIVAPRRQIFAGYLDCRKIFWYPTNPEVPLDCDLDTVGSDIRKNRELAYKYTSVFKYEEFTVEQLDEYFDINYAHWSPFVLNKNKFLEYMCSDYNRFMFYTPEELLLVCNMCNLDKKEVYDFVKKQGFGKKYHINTLISEYNWEILLD